MGTNSGCGCGCGSTESKKDLTKVSWSVPGIKCGGCAGKLETTLKEVAGVKCVSVKAEEKTVTLNFDATQATEAQLLEVLGKAGYAVA
jgi:Zn2+/Cd2+-exporting ATPase